MIRNGLLFGLAVGLAMTLGAVANAADTPATAGTPIYADKGEQTCLKCHDDAPLTEIFKTPHAVKGDARTPAANHGCESCHGASPEHVASRPAKGEKKVLPTVRFSGPNASPVADRNAVCLTCHENTNRINWQGSKHDTNDVACTTCHTVHAAKDPVLVKATQPDTCFSCHARQRAESFELSHHPVREGKVACADCHNVHGAPGPKMLKEFTLNETCYTCHADKRGPLLWEHEPVREDCSTCHTAHGSTQVALLKRRPSFLCVSCHQNGGHQSSVFGGSVLPGSPTVQPNNVGAVSTRVLARGCVNCHSQIHGSNNPQGGFFTR
ncbi:DmsE family decaheme c-type cytochrome [Telmatospirillum sp.]|uniref:DmsE family decaheme c-type cytochrome n=1 Tax=Telmatospirillum sp. TaxID=2079197 RepID=UPI00284A78AF|nr:DmsE family decaheme c-type cytochrome [Telmatospirillum sp.]MDR3437114.1 DmsE family decaheme c-type cytochrome [Telmatospirillum sp.]